MNVDCFYEDGARLLTPEAFVFLLAAELRRVIRAQAFLSLVSIEVRRVWNGLTVAADDATVDEVGALVAREVRACDAIARAGRGLLRLLLPDADVSAGASVIARVMARADGYRFASPIAISIGAACCPTDAVDAESLKRVAFSRPMVSARRGVHPLSPTD